MKPMGRESIDDDFVIGYMCQIDFKYELGLAMGGNTVYPSLDDLKENHDCWEECGIVEVKVSFVKSIHEGTY